MKYYRDTNFNFIFYSVFPLFFIVLCLYDKEHVEETIIAGFFYGLLLISVIVPIILKRRKVKKIQKNGRCYCGTVEKLMEVVVGNTFNRFGHTEYHTAYYLKVLPQGESNADRFVYSDILIGSKGQKIAKDVLIYDWYGETFVVCSKIKRKKFYEVEHTRKVVNYSWNRQLFIFLNRLFTIGDILMIIGLLYANIKGI